MQALPVDLYFDGRGRMVGVRVVLQGTRGSSRCTAKGQE